MDETDRTIGERVRAAREARGWSQEDLAKRIGAKQQTIVHIESGKTRRTSLLPALARAFRIHVDELEFGAALVQIDEAVVVKKLADEIDRAYRDAKIKISAPELCAIVWDELDIIRDVATDPAAIDSLVHAAANRIARKLEDDKTPVKYAAGPIKDTG